MDAFLVFNIDYKFEIDQLDKIYYKLYKKSNNKQKEEINQAYLILKDPFLRICNLCESLSLNARINLEEIFKIIEEENDIYKYSDNLLNEVYEKAKNNEMEICCELLEKYKYLKKFHNQ